MDNHDHVIQSIGEQCDRAAKKSQEAWAANQVDAARDADREYYRLVRLYHAHVLRKSIDAGLTQLRDEDRELLRLIEN
jgi:hypothetical protein